jgi:hypothetical protein
VSERPKETVVQKQARFNRSTRAHWQHFAPHRARVQELILTGRELSPAGKFCALGAGNCNDLELPSLLDHFEQVHLADIDPASLNEAAERQGVATRTGLHLHAPTDLTDIAEIVSTWQTRPPTLPDVKLAIRVSDHATALELGGPFDLVLSSCVLSQLLAYATDTLGGEEHPGFKGLVRSIRARHLRLMLDLLKPGGTGLLICDLVSSDSLDALPRVPEHELPGLIHKIARDGNFFSGLYPDAVLAAMRSEPDIANRIDEPKLLSPWLWRLGPARSFLVYAIRFRKIGIDKIKI